MSDILRLEPQMQYNIYQGNFTDVFLLGRVTGSDEPESIRYLGVNIQDGFFCSFWLKNNNSIRM